MLTHGEKWYSNKTRIQSLPNFEDYNAESGCPPRMGRADAVKYYNTKLFNYWLEMLDVPKHKEEVLLFLMFHNKKSIKLNQK